MENSLFGDDADAAAVRAIDRAWQALIGHPRLYRADEPSTALELVAIAPALRVQRRKGGLRVALQPPLPNDGMLRVEEENRNRWRVVRFDESHRQIGELLGRGLKVPAEAEDRVREAIARIAPRIDIHSDIGGDEDLHRPSRPQARAGQLPAGRR